MKFKLNGRPVEVTEIEGEIGEGAYALSAEFADNGEELDDDQLEELNENFASELYDAHFQNLVSRADSYADYYRDGSSN